MMTTLDTYNLLVWVIPSFLVVGVVAYLLGLMDGEDQGRDKERRAQTMLLQENSGDRRHPWSTYSRIVGASGVSNTPQEGPF